MFNYSHIVIFGGQRANNKIEVDNIENSSEENEGYN